MAAMPAQSSPFSDFLYARVGDDKNGMVLTVLSALARLNVDPWEEAADLSRLPGETAVGRFVAMLEGLPGFASIAVRTDLARRLIPLLPRPVAPGAGRIDPVGRFLTANRSPQATNIFVMVVYVAIMLLGQWVLSGFFETGHDGDGAVAATTPAQTPTPAKPSR
jgi:hypothetical protein